ncbi:MAG: hypothetical protein EP297_04725 [Gammaproteobacteria bacterium]|nr:MAG: hypothetical protein EP297_04725 [Gammaproteobacteria bacterium]
MMNLKKLISATVAATLAAALSMPAFAGPGNPTGKLLGSFNMIGHPKNVDVLPNDNSNGRAIMIPLKNARGPESITCEEDEVVLVDDTAPDYSDTEPTGAKIHFTAGDSFEIVDRDATDRDGAEIQVPTDTSTGEPVLSVGIWLRVLGKPNTCIDIDAYAYDFDQSLYFFAGSVDLNRKTGKATWVKVNDLFDVYFCDVDPTTELCVDGTTQELSVFNNVFEDYFWNILNDGTRIVQARLYAMD